MTAWVMARGTGVGHDPGSDGTGGRMGDDAAVDLLATMPFAGLLGMWLESASADEVVVRLDHRPELCTVGGLLHGGVLMSLADSTGAVCAFLGMPDGASTATTSSHTSLLRPARSGTLTATARPVHRGRTSVVVQTDVTADGDRLVSRTTQTQAVLLPR